MPQTWDVIASTTLSTTASSIDFTSITSSYTDLVALVSARFSSSGHLAFTVNNDSGNNYSYVGIYGRAPDGNPTGSEYSTENAVNLSAMRGSAFSYFPSASNIYGGAIIHFMNYSSTFNVKDFLVRNSTVGASNYAGIEFTVGSYYGSTSAISRITFSRVGGGNFETGSVITLYGIART
jgi:hypothetical protein